MSKIRICALTIFLVLPFALHSHADVKCDNSDIYACLKELIQIKRTSEPLREKFRKLYMDAESRAKSCKFIDDTSRFLDISEVTIWGTHTYEEFNKSLESLLLSNPDCFLEALLRLDRDSREHVFDKIINPIGLSSLEKVDAIFEKFPDKTKYNEVLQQYWNLRGK